jgi:hypothetical protein
MKKLIALATLSALIIGCASNTRPGAAVKIEDPQSNGKMQGRGTTGVSTGASGTEFNTGSGVAPR